MIILKKLKSQMNGSLFSNTTFNTYEQTIQSENGTFFHSHKWIDLSGNLMGTGWSGYLGVAEGKKCQIGNVKSSSSPFPFNEY